MIDTTSEGGEAPKAETAAKTSNTVSGNAKGTVQAGVIETINNYGANDKVELFARQVNEQELDDVRKQFQPPGEFERAGRVLTASKVVVLLGTGTGRTFAAHRLLDGEACARIVHLSPERSMGSVNDGDLCAGDGYVWDMAEQGSRPFKGWQLSRMRRLVAGTADCRLVVILNDSSQVPLEAEALCVTLEPPDAMAVAAAAIDREPGDTVGARQVLEREFTDLLTAGVAPERALLAAGLAMRVAHGELDADKARQDFELGFDREVADIIKDEWETIEYTLMFTVALLQNEPFDEVADEARNLDKEVRTSELKEGKKLKPRRVFVKPSDELLRAIGACVDKRDNPSHKGLKVDTVRFEHTGWAEAVLCRIWQYYHVEHDLLVRWMCGPRMSRLHFDASVWALSTLISQVPAGDRLRELHRLVNRGGFRNWRLAAATLARLEDKHGFGDLVQQAVAEWVESDGAYQKCAAVVFYAYRFDQSDGRLTMVRIADIAREKMTSVHDTTVGTVLRLMTARDRLPTVLRAVVSWADDRRSVRDKDGLRSVALDVGVYLLRLTAEARSVKLDLDPADIAECYPADCRHLAAEIMDHKYYGFDVLKDLLDLGMWQPFILVDKAARQHAIELVRIARLLAPDLRWRARRATVVRLCRRYPGRQRQIRWIFRMARKAERTGLCGGDGRVAGTEPTATAA